MFISPEAPKKTAHSLCN